MTQITPKPLFYSGFVLFRPFFQKAQKMPKTYLAESPIIRGRCRGGDFCNISLFFSGLIFFGSFRPLNPKDAVKIPIFVVFSRFSVHNFSVSPKHPRTIFSLNFWFLEFWLPQRAKIAKHRGQIVWPGFPPRVLGPFAGFLAQKCFSSADRVLAPKRVAS